MIYFAILLAVFLYFFGFFKNFYQTWQIGKALPGPPAWPLIGNMLMFFNLSPPEIFATLCKVAGDYGGVARLWLGSDLFILVSNPKDMEAVLSSQVYIDKSKEYSRLHPWLNDGLLVSTGKKWHQRRKAITPAFHFKILERYLEVFEQQGETFVQILSKHLDKKPFELYPLVTLYALDVICESAMGTKMNAQLNADSAYVRAVKEESHIMQSRVFDVLLKNDFIYQFTNYARREKKALATLHNFTNSVIQSRKQELKDNQHMATEQDHDDGIGTKRKNAFLDLLLKSTIDGQPLTDEDIREEVDTFMFEGHDTTTSGITFTMYNIAKYPDVQEKCIQEIIEVIGKDKTKQMTYADLNSLNYLEKVIKETLRIYPSVPFIGRELREDALINGKLFPAGSSLILFFFTMGRCADYFKDPLAFRPDRFDNPEFDTFAYVPFSAGPRNCIGQKFAMLEMKSAIAKILRHFIFELSNPNEELVLLSEAILRPHKPINFCLKSRDY